MLVIAVRYTARCELNPSGFSEWDAQHLVDPARLGVEEAGVELGENARRVGLVDDADESHTRMVRETAVASSVPAVSARRWRLSRLRAGAGVP